MPLFAGPLESDETYLYHYTSSATLALILDGGALRLGPYAGTRDPRENREWHPGYSYAEGTDARPEVWDMFAVSRVLDAAIRQRAKLACLTLDRPAISPWADQFARGYGRARMWEQYGDRHRGAVLMFRRPLLDAAVQEQLGHHEHLFSGPVGYADEPIDMTRALHFRVEDTQDAESITRVADAAIKNHGKLLFFGKNTDWSTEAEYRYVVISGKEAEFVPIRESLVAIVLGMDFPSHEATVLRHRLQKLGLPELPLARALWQNGQPIIVPAIL